MKDVILIFQVFCFLGVGDLESTDGVGGILPSSLVEETNDTEQEDAYQADGNGTFWNTDSHRNIVDGI